MRKSLKDFGKKFLNLFLGEVCIGCRKEGKMICEECEKEIKDTKRNKNIETVSWIYSPLSYKNKIVRQALFLLKYSYVTNVSKYLAKIVSKDFLFFLKDKIEENKLDYKNLLILPIPISKKRLLERNYNQSEVLIKDILLEIKEKYNLDLNPNLFVDFLLKTKHTTKFAKTHSHTDREKLIRNIFAVNEKYKEDFLKEKIIFLIDDITTTGVTFYEARNELIKNGFQKEKIFGFAIAH